MNLTINGQARTVPEDATIVDLLEQLGLQTERVAVECNGLIIERDSFPAHRLAAGDVIEVVRFVGGG